MLRQKLTNGPVKTTTSAWTLQCMEDGLEGVSSSLLCAGESLQTMVFPQPVDKEKEKRKEEQFIKISLIKYFSTEI